MHNPKYVDLVQAATLAPNSHNTQPWKFSICDNTIHIVPDFSRRLAVVDPNDRELYISLGCAVENLVIAAQESGYATEVEYLPTDENRGVCVRLSVSSARNDNKLFAAITQRQSTRSIYDLQAVPLAQLQELERVPARDNIARQLFTDPGEIECLIELVKEGDRRQYRNRGFMDELVSWLRFNDAEARRFGDGLSARCSGNPTVPRWFGKLVATHTSPGSYANSDANKIRSSAGMILLVSPRDDYTAWLDTGRTFERLALTCTLLNIKTAFMNQPIEVPELRLQLQQHLHLQGMYPQLLLRFGYSNAMPRSLRRPVEQVLQRSLDSTDRA